MQRNARHYTVNGFPLEVVSPAACFHCLSGPQGAADGARLLGRVSLCPRHALDLTAAVNAANALLKR